MEPEEFRIKFTEAPIAATKTVDGFACPFAGVGATTAHLTGQILTKGAAGVETVGVGVGRPTTLCDHNEAPCDEANIYGAGTLLEGESTNTTVKVEGHTNNGAWSITIGCAKAVFKANTNQRWGNPGLPATIQNFFFNSCAIGGNACTIAQVVWWNGRIFGDAANARYRFSAQRMRVTCNTWPLLCDFTGVVQAPISGGTPGSLSITPVILARQAGAPGETANCTGTAPTTAEFQGNYSLLKPSPLFVAQ